MAVKTSIIKGVERNTYHNRFHLNISLKTPKNLKFLSLSFIKSSLIVDIIFQKLDALLLENPFGFLLTPYIFIQSYLFIS